MSRHLFVVTTLLLAALCGCGRPAPAAAEKPAILPFEPMARQREGDDAARFLAGMPGKPGSPFAELEGTPEWQKHRAALDEAWGRAETGLIRDFRDFQKKELDDPAVRDTPVFYPFGGPDALTVTLFFPRTPVYVLVGLEPAGTLPQPKDIGRKELGRYLDSVRETVASVLGRSFFVTREMDRQFRGQVTDGLLVPILHLLVRSGHTILAFRWVRIDEQGKVVERAANWHAAGRIGNKGVEIDYRTDADESIHRLAYFSVNLSDPWLKDDKAFLTYAGGLKGWTTLLKATSYMMHKKGFNIIRDTLLANSGAILQDDSGIPFRCFGAGQWQLQLYGDYERPYGSFRWLEQPDLRKAYHETGVKKLEMPIGYGYRKITANLLLARRVGPGQ